MRPSGFLVAMHSGVLRVTYDGVIVHRYDVHGDRPGQYFALNIAPDGQSFWTATFQTDDEALPAAGHLYKFDIPSGALIAGPIAVRDVAGARVRSVWGLCVKGEYTAAVNRCLQTNPDGSAKLDANGNPIAAACRVPEVCGTHDGVDEDGDGLADRDDPDCTAPAPVRPADPPSQGTMNCSVARPSVPEIWPPNGQWVNVLVEGVAGAGGSAAAITVDGIFQDEPTITAGGLHTAFDGAGVGTAVALLRAERADDSKGRGNGRVYEIHFTATSGADSCTGSVRVGVPHVRGKGPAVDDGLRYDSTAR